MTNKKLEQLKTSKKELDKAFQGLLGCFGKKIPKELEKLIDDYHFEINIPINKLIDTETKKLQGSNLG